MRAALLLALALPASADDFARALAEPRRALLAEAERQKTAPQPREYDVTGRELSLEAARSYQRVLSTLRGRRLTPDEGRLVLAILNLPPSPPGPFRTREQLVLHFLREGVGAKGEELELAQRDLWRVVRAARAAENAYKIPAAVLLCLTFRESSFEREASAWTTTAKGVAQLTNGAVEETMRQIHRDPMLMSATRAYARELGGELPDMVRGAPDVDALTREIQRLRAAKASPARIEEKKRERRQAIARHKDEPGHIYNLETNFGLGAAYLAHLRRRRLAGIADERKGWLTAVAAYNQGIGYAHALVALHGGPAGYAAASLDEIFSERSASAIGLPPERQHELLGEIGSVRRCAIP